MLRSDVKEDEGNEESDSDVSLEKGYGSDTDKSRRGQKRQGSDKSRSDKGRKTRGGTLRFNDMCFNEDEDSAYEASSQSTEVREVVRLDNREVEVRQRLDNLENAPKTQQEIELEMQFLR
jgi:hypothetical protein